jgi:hypothetical protein
MGLSMKNLGEAGGSDPSAMLSILVSVLSTVLISWQAKRVFDEATKAKGK